MFHRQRTLFIVTRKLFIGQNLYFLILNRSHQSRLSSNYIWHLFIEFTLEPTNHNHAIINLSRCIFDFQSGREPMVSGSSQAVRQNIFMNINWLSFGLCIFDFDLLVCFLWFYRQSSIHGSHFQHTHTHTRFCPQKPTQTPIYKFGQALKNISYDCTDH